MTLEGDGELVSFGHSSDALLHLREWGADRTHALPDPPYPGLIGTANECVVRLSDMSAAANHALLTHDGEQWWIGVRDTQHVIRQNGVSSRRFALTPGVEVGIGATTLVAENRRTVQLRNFCKRLLGWSADRLHDVDHAMRAIRLAQACRSALILCGEGDLVPVAHALHRYVRGEHAPFIVCDPRRRNIPVSVRSPANNPGGIEALAAAVGGSVCLRQVRLPRDVDMVVRRVCQRESDAQLFICMSDRHRSVVLSDTLLIEMPPLQIRETEISRIVEEYAQDAMYALGAPATSFTDDDLTWVVAYSAQSLPVIAKATLRLVALRASENVSQAAARLGMAPVSLSRWLGRRAPPGMRSKTRVTGGPWFHACGRPQAHRVTSTTSGRR